MSFFGKLKDPFKDIKKAVQSYGRPALHLKYNNSFEPFSKLGQMPYVPKEFEWPAWKGRSLAFLMQLKFSEVNKDGYLPYLPTSGLLYVFYDEEQSTWGFDPQDKGSWRLLFFEKEDGLKARRYPKDLGTRYKLRHIESFPIVTYPPYGDDEIGAVINNDDDLWERYNQFRLAGYGDSEPYHHLGGYPDPIQSTDMDLECQLVSNGVDLGDDSGHDSSRESLLAADRDEWILLLQIDSDDFCEMMWGDCGILYFWIRKGDLAARNFDDVWMILQSS
jgi:uncharacterized protein YwqG